MKNTLLHFLYSFCIILLLVNAIVTHHDNNVLESRINTLNKNGIDFNSEKTFKEDYYIKQQSSDTTLLLVVFPIIVGFVALFTFANVVQKFRTTKTEIENDIKEKEAKWDKQHKRLSKLELDLYFQIANNYSDKAKKHEEENNLKSYISISMCALEKYAQVIKVCDNIIYKQRVLNLLNSSVDYDYTLLKDTENIFEISDLDYSVYKIRVAAISEALDSERLQMFNTILSKIKII
ncbi:hypothetical protein [Flavobacterium franklandianum]|uniref:Uncharacterized protein n=1 Tax=Flavobacterium franklandianum TaxID=2594430 RepID=A0A553C5W2_9FLAO|nr:hypothetical protein [Flavobacterium franklandianum]TRX15888.1 hypothetical protein FNW17_15840 [Flavobacterium franklandianum]